MKPFIFFFAMLLIAILTVGCSVRDVHYKPDVIVAKLDKEIKKEIKGQQTPLIEERESESLGVQSFSTVLTPAEAQLSLETSNEITFGSYKALVIGVNEYPFFRDLQTAGNDARAIAHLLKHDYGFRVKLMINPKRSEIIAALADLRRTLSRSDNLLIYYAGHGWLDDGANEGYWLPSDARKADEANWISNATITSSIRAMQAKHIMIVVDSCYAGKLIRGIHIERRTPDYVARISQKIARVVLTSGGLEPVVDSSSNNRHSVFASSFIKALLENDGVMDGTQLFSRIRRPVMLNSDQTPEYSDIRKAGHDGGDFLFVRKTSPTSPVH